MSQPHFEEVWGWHSHSRNGDLRTPENSEFDYRSQNTLPWSFFYTVGKFLRCRYWKWPCMSHLDIYNTSHGRKKAGVKLTVWFSTTKRQELTQPRFVLVKCNTSLESSHPNRRSEQGVMNSQSLGSPNRDNFGTPPWKSGEKVPFGCRCHG